MPEYLGAVPISAMYHHHYIPTRDTRAHLLMSRYFLFHARIALGMHIDEVLNQFHHMNDSGHFEDLYLPSYLSRFQKHGL